MKEILKILFESDNKFNFFLGGVLLLKRGVDFFFAFIAEKVSNLDLVVRKLQIKRFHEYSLIIL